jgi:Leucine-rich repeat (LRR) protein
MGSAGRMRHVRLRLRCRLAGLLLLIGTFAGCGLPTWGELIGAKPAPTTPVVVPVQPPQARPTQVTPPTPPPPSPEEVIGRFHELKSYEIDDAKLASILALESGLEEIQSLNLNGSRVTNHGLKDLGKLSHLTTLDVRNTPVDSDGAAAIASVPSLEVLRIEGSRFSDSGVSALQPLKSLRVLDISHIRLTAQGWQQFLALPELEELAIHGSNVNDEVLLMLSRCPKLRRLSMNDNPITDLGLAQLGRLDALESLWISGCGITGIGFRSPEGGRGAFLALQELMMRRCPLNEFGAKAISTMKQLRRLDIAEMPSMQDIHFIEMIKPLKELTWLHSGANTGLTSRALTAVAGHTSLEYLGIGNCHAMDDRGLQQLVKLKNLQQLDLHNTRCTPGGVLALKEYIPELKVVGLEGVAE